MLGSCLQLFAMCVGVGFIQNGKPPPKSNYELTLPESSQRLLKYLEQHPGKSIKELAEEGTK